MERDYQLKKLLEKGGEAASADFTANILNKIEQLKPAAIAYQPLVSDSIKRIFIRVFASVVILIFLLLIIMKASAVTFINHIQLPMIGANTYRNVIVFIVTFWTMFSVQILIKKLTSRSVKTQACY